MMSELTRSGLPLSDDRMRYIVKLRAQAGSELGCCESLAAARAADAPAGQTGDRAEQALERLGHVVRDEVLVDCRDAERQDVVSEKRRGVEEGTHPGS
mgnify:CR=1 FL=1